MTISMYQASVPSFIRILTNLAAILEMGAAHAEAKKIEPSVLVNSRLSPDMFPLVRQIQIATDTVKGYVARVSGQEPPKFEDNETSFPELVARINKTIAYLKTFKPAQIDGSEEKTITLPMRSGALTFTGMAYLVDFVYPNFYFHVSIAYGILRHSGVQIGKQDFLGRP